MSGLNKFRQASIGLQMVSTLNHFSSSWTLSLEASFWRLAKVSATRMGKTRVASLKIFTYWASSLSLAQVQASEGLAPESEPSSQSPVLMNTAQSSPLRQMLALRMWCLGTLPPSTMAPDLSALIAILDISLWSSTTSMARSFLQELVKRTSPRAPSVMAGQNTGMSFLQHQQQMLWGWSISLPSRAISLLGVHRTCCCSCSCAILEKMGSRKFSSLTQLSLGTRMLPIRQCPFSLFSASFMLNSPKWKVPMHFIKSSQIPPAVVTMQSIILCCARQRTISLTPQEAMLEVQPRKMVQRTLARQEGSLVSSSSRSLRGSWESLQSIIWLTIWMALWR